MADEDAHEPYLLIFSDIKNKLGCIGPSKISWRVACALHGIGTERLGANAGSRFSWIRTKQQPSFLFLKKHSEHLSKKFRSTRKLPSLHFRKGWQDKKELQSCQVDKFQTKKVANLIGFRIWTILLPLSTMNFEPQLHGYDNHFINPRTDFYIERLMSAGLTPAHLEEGPTTDEESQRAKLHLPRIPSLFTWICLLFSRSTC
ncbi:hypothetical protein BRADI_1g71371v3 [Brachypodium distachyon]|uniref:Uncharacterized protein n=1 Tax=Brachypodium distachyon TaxID=15368 RepID=A0A0Q3NZF0_BRADI|nr:hypothetical protein BRADI_1g71371v3 [Brachypodium distachyon]